MDESWAGQQVRGADKDPGSGDLKAWGHFLVILFPYYFQAAMQMPWIKVQISLTS